MAIQHILINIMILSFIDIFMTFYQFVIFKKYKFLEAGEMNPLFNIIINKKPSPIKFIICNLIAQTFLLTAIYLAQYNLLFMGYFIGVLFTVNMYHLYNIFGLYRFVKSKTYEKLKKIEIENV